MKVLAIMGGPRKGYGTIITEKIEAELISLQDLEFEYLYLKDVNLESCIGCHNCFFKGEDKCPFSNDARDEILNKIFQADGLIFTAPAYALHIPALMKNFFDRLSYIFHRPCFFGKIAIGMCNYGIAGAKKVTNYFNEVSDSWGINYIDSLKINTQPKPGIEKKISKKIKKTSKKFIKALNTQKPKKPSLADVIGFKVRKLLHNIAHDETNADVQYWSEQGWLDDDTKYYYEVRLGIVKRLIAGLINMMVKPQFKKIFADDPKLKYDQYQKLQSIKFGV
ncbi:MAG: flavodoxin family protein [Candidatus Lokiarchaeota archaeon]|nr:flavodoxin family protein [Candidatus Lokiarchaeota archaeon]